MELPDGERRVDRWFNTEAFAPPPIRRRGTSGRGIIRGLGLQLWEISVRKRFTVTECARLQLQADLFNAFNRTNFRDLATDFGQSVIHPTTGRITPGNQNFGTISNAAPGRNIQFGVKLTF